MREASGGQSGTEVAVIDLVGAGGHDEVVAVQAPDCMGPPAHRDLAPLGDQARMVACGFGGLAHGLGKGEGCKEVGETVGLLQLGNALLLDDLPLGQFG